VSHWLLRTLKQGWMTRLKGDLYKRDNLANVNRFAGLNNATDVLTDNVRP